jgi:predicted metal-dependent hydrolase
MAEREIFLEGAGKVVIRKRRGTRRMSIRINRQGQVRMTMPFFMSFTEAEDFLISRKDWVEKTLRKLSEQQPLEAVYGEGRAAQTNRYAVIVERCVSGRFSRKFTPDTLRVLIPLSVELTGEEAQVYIRNSIAAAVLREAKEFLPLRIQELAGIHGFRYTTVSVRNMRSRWGSCSGKNGISLNMHLMRVPAELRDYVLLHELVHTVHKHHGPRFWQELEKHAPGARKLSARLRKYSTDMTGFRA